MSIFRLDPLKGVEKTESTNSNFTHASGKEMLYNSIYEPNESITTYKAYEEALQKPEEIQQWHSNPEMLE